jgi:ketosteroid isomerase-like protein
LAIRTGRSKATQKPFSSRWSMVFTLRGGKVTRFEEHQDTATIEKAFTAQPMAARG